MTPAHFYLWECFLWDFWIAVTMLVKKSHEMITPVPWALYHVSWQITTTYLCDPDMHLIRLPSLQLVLCRWHIQWHCTSANYSGLWRWSTMKNRYSPPDTADPLFRSSCNSVRYDSRPPSLGKRTLLLAVNQLSLSFLLSVEMTPNQLKWTDSYKKQH